MIKSSSNCKYYRIILSYLLIYTYYYDNLVINYCNIFFFFNTNRLHNNNNNCNCCDTLILQPHPTQDISIKCPQV